MNALRSPRYVPRPANDACPHDPLAGCGLTQLERVVVDCLAEELAADDRIRWEHLPQCGRTAQDECCRGAYQMKAAAALGYAGGQVIWAVFGDRRRS